MANFYPDDPEMEELAARHRRFHRRRLAGLVIVLAVVLAVAFVATFDHSKGDPGNLTEPLFDWTGPVPDFTDVTEAWSLAGWRNTAESEASGGVAIGDINRDGFADLVVAGGSAVVYLGTGDGFDLLEPALAEDTVAVDLADVDGDGRLDVLLGRERGPDLIVWGDTLFEDGRVISELDSGGPSTGMIAADFDGDARVDILRLGYGGGRAAPDIVWRQEAPRMFEPTELPDSRRRSYAAAVADLDGAGGLDIWVTRDVGWRSGGDSLYVLSRSGEGGWIDLAPAYGTDMEIDGMGVTLADFSGDQQIDIYLSDLGDNELLRRGSETLQTGGLNYVRDTGRGIGRIRAPGEEPDMVSSSWGSGVADLNLDGYLDLVVVNGGFPTTDVDNKIPNTRVAASDPPAIFLGLPGEFRRWADVWPALGLSWDGLGRGLALGDLDGDLDTDIVISTRNAGLRVFRNDTEGPAVSIELVGACDPTGLFVDVATDPLLLRLPLAAPAFLGRHGAEFILGTRGAGGVVASATPGAVGSDVVFEGVGRQSLTVTCEQVGRPRLR